MAIDSDNMISLPPPPPPRPAARRAAIDAAIRKFDGVEDTAAERAARKRPSRIAWATMHRRPAGALVTAALIAIVFIPVVPFILRDRPSDVIPRPEMPNQVQPGRDASLCAGPDCAGRATSETDQSRPDETDVAAASPSLAQPAAEPLIVAEDRRGEMPAASDRKAALEAPATVVGAPAAPAPPPPPPPAPSEPEAAGHDSIVVTGSRIPASNMAKQNQANEVGYAAKPATRSAMIEPYGEFLSRLQAGLRANDRRAVIRLIALPLRVKFGGESRTYRSSRDIERDFDRIFTADVRQAALNQRPEALISREGGRMLSNGRLRFGPSCSNKSCSPDSSIRVREVTP